MNSLDSNSILINILMQLKKITNNVFFKQYYLYALVFLLTLIRFLFLDSDTPSLFVSHLCAEDEAYYCVSGIDKYLVQTNSSEGCLYLNEFMGLNLYSHYPVYFFLKLFGNNFWAMRFFPVLISIAFNLLLADVLRIIIKNKILLCFATIYACSDFTLFMYSRYNGPLIYSLGALMFLIWLFVKFKYWLPKNLIMLGMFSVLSVTVIYIFNLFFFVGLGMYLSYISFKKKNMKYIFYYGMGAILGVLIFQIILVLSGTSIADIIYLMANQKANETSKILNTNSGISSFILLIFSNLKFVISSLINNNMFRYNQSLLLLFIFVLGTFFSNFRKIDSIIFLSFFVFGLGALQLFFVPSYPIKKLAVLFPVVLIFTFKRLDYLYYSLKDTVLSPKRKFALISYLMLGLICVIFNYKTMNNQATYSYYIKIFGNYTPPPSYLMISQLLITIVIGFGLIYFIIFNKLNLKIIMIFAIVPSLLFIYYFTFINCTYKIRDSLIADKVIVNNKYVCSDYGYYYYFYSGGIPFYNTYNLKADHNNELASIPDSIFNLKKEVFEKRKVTASNEIYNYKVNDTITENNRKYLVINKHIITNYNYMLLKRFE